MSGGFNLRQKAVVLKCQASTQARTDVSKLSSDPVLSAGTFVVGHGGQECWHVQGLLGICTGSWPARYVCCVLCMQGEGLRSIYVCMYAARYVCLVGCCAV